MEPTEESVNLVFRSLVHLIEPNLFQILNLSLIRDRDVLSIFFQIHNVILSKVLSDHRESQSQIIDVAVDHVHVAAIELIIKVFEVLKCQILANHHLVQGLGQLQLEQLVVINGFSDHFSDELEVVKMVLVDVRLLVWVEGHTVGSQSEEEVLSVEHGLRQLSVEVSCQASSVDTGLPAVSDVQGLSHILRALEHEVLVSIRKDVLAPHVDIKLSVGSVAPLDLLTEPGLLALKVHNVWHVADVL